ncbi:MAG: YdcF family protein, partial [Burkholderiaceae bacterium]|nr:YdcF family protein [Burkholderiaceae bacterium]
MPADAGFAATLYAVAKALLLPPGALILLALAGALAARRFPRAGTPLCIGALALLYLVGTPLGASLLTLLLAPTEPVAPERVRAMQALVIPGGGLRAHAAEYGGETLAPLTLERVRYGATLARESGLPVLVAGGRPPGYRASEAALMREALEREFGVPVQWQEERSRNTRE